MDACCWHFPMNGVDKWGDDNVFLYTSSHRFLWNGTGLVLHLTDQLDTAFAWNQIILATFNDLYILCTERRFAKMQTICRPCHSQACQCSALIDEGEEVIQCTFKVWLWTRLWWHVRMQLASPASALTFWEACLSLQSVGLPMVHSLF